MPYQAAISWDTGAPPSIVEVEFLRWLETDDGRLVEREAIARSRALISRGWKSYSMDAIFHSIRWTRNIELGPDHGFKLNNNHLSHMARHLMRKYPDLAGFFELRELRGRAWRKARRGD